MQSILHVVALLKQKLRSAESKIMKAAGKTMPKKTASRKVARLAKKIAKIA